MVDLHKEFAPKGLEIVRNPSRAAVVVAALALLLLMLMLLLFLLILLFLLFLLFLPILLFLLFLFYRVLKKNLSPFNFIL